MKLVPPPLAAAALLCLSACDPSNSPPYLQSVKAISYYPGDPPSLKFDFQAAGGDGTDSSYTTEMQLDGASFVAVAPVGVPPLPPAVKSVAFRLRADATGLVSNALPFHGSPWIDQFIDPAGLKAAPIEVHFGYTPYLLGAQLVLERRISTPDPSLGVFKAQGPWSQVATGSAADNTYPDSDLSTWTEGTVLEYRAVVHADDAEEASDPTVDQAGPLAEPTILSTQVYPTGVVEVSLQGNSYAPEICWERVGGPSGTDAAGSAAAPRLGDSIDFTNRLPTRGSYLFRFWACPDYLSVDRKTKVSVVW
jgi:hypothetical protein